MPQSRPKRLASKKDESSDSDFDDDDPDHTEVPGGGVNLESAKSLKNDPDLDNANIKVTSKIDNKAAVGSDDSKQVVDGEPVPISNFDHNGTKMDINAANVPNSAGSAILEQLMSKPSLNPNFDKSKFGLGGTNLGQMMQPQSYFNFPPSMSSSMMYNPGLQGFPQMPQSNFNPTQFFPVGMDMSSMVSAMMMSPSIQAAMNPFLMSGNGNALFNQLLSQGHGFNQWGGMPQLPSKMLAQLWAMTNMNKMNARADDEEDNEDEEMGVAETYADYMPSKLKLGKKHPDPVVETASLSSVEPTDVWYKLSLPEERINTGALSALQLEAITYAAQQHEHLLPDGSRAGFLIGDGAGVGKGRTIAGIIYENFLKGRKKAIWVSVSNDLKYDAERDLNDIKANGIKVYQLNKFKYTKIMSPQNGNVKKGVIFSTYSALIGESTQTGGKYKTRLKQLLHWCGNDFEGPIIFDECHRAKNLCPVGSTKPTKTGLTVLEIQKQLPKARVVYASATGASEPRNMAYMTRLGMWGKGSPFPEFMDFINAVEKRGVGAMEIVAMDMKLRGMYIARQLSFHGVTFKIEEVPLPEKFIKMYDDSVELWIELMNKFTEAAELIDAENRMKKTMWGQFWSAHQRFFKYLCIASKVKHAVEVAREAIKCGKCVVIGLQSTGEARTLEQLEREDGELSDFVSTAKGVLQSLVEKHFPAPDRNRIQRLLGIDPKKQQNGKDDCEPGSSSGKRKSRRQAATKAKRHKELSDSDADVNSDDSEFKMSASETPSDDDEESIPSSGTSSDFINDSDSDDFLWEGKNNNKKGMKKKNPVKKLTAQDRIDMLITGRGMKGKNPVSRPPKDAVELACKMKEELLEKIEAIGERLPPNTLDQLIDELGGTENVAEMTGRKGRVVQTDAGIQYESRSEIDIPLETLNLTEKQRFMDGEKDVAIISEAASSGISLQSDRRVKNQRRRVHITLELPWSADRAVQQFGRTHRSNQVNAPEYIFLISELAGEKRFASIVAKRLESLGALTHGDRRATETRDLSQFNIDNKYGRTALESTMKGIVGIERPPLVPPPKDYKGDFFGDVAGALLGVGLLVNGDPARGFLMLDKDFNNMSKFLNRILGMKVDLQNRLFKYFTDTLHAVITQAKKSGRFDLGILDLGSAGENVKRVKMYTFLRKHTTGTATTQLHIVQVERGMSWEEATEKWSELSGSEEGFYLSHQVRNGKQTTILAVGSGKKGAGDSNKKDQFYVLYRPNTGLQLRQETLAEMEKKYKKVETSEAEKHWKEQYTTSETTCSHAYWRGNCKSVAMGLDCEVGLRRRTYNVVAGSVLSVWARVENVLAAKTGHSSKMQVVRLKTTDGVKIVGTLIPKSCVEPLREALASDAEKTAEETF